MRSLHIHYKSILLDLLRRAWLIVLAFLIVFLTTYFMVEKKKVPYYTANADVLVYPSEDASKNTSSFVTSTDHAALGLINLLKVLITKDVSTQIIMEHLDPLDGVIDGKYIGSSGITYSQRTIGAMLRLASANDTRTMGVSVSAATAEDAVMIVNAAGEAMPEIVKDVVGSGYAKPLQYSDSAIKSNLPSYRKPFTYASVIAIILAAIIIMLNIFDSRIHSKEEIINEYGLLMLGEIPHFSARRNSGERRKSHYETKY